MTSGKELIEAVRSSLEAEGHLAQIKAQMQTKVMKLLGSSSRSNKSETPKCAHARLMNELIREYLDWMGYKYTCGTFIEESQLSKQSLDRTFLEKSLGVQDSEMTEDLPLLCSLIETYKYMKEM